MKARRLQRFLRKLIPVRWVSSTICIKPLQSVIDIKKIEKEYCEKPLAEIIEELKQYSSREFVLEVKRVSGKLLYFIKQDNSECFWPSYFSAYFYCAKKLWLQHKLGALIVGEKGLRSIARGLKIHEVYVEYLDSLGLNIEPDVLVEGEYYGYRVRGYIDFTLDGIPFEIKTGYREHLGHRLQLMLYEKLLGASRGYLVYSLKVMEVKLDSKLLEKYFKRVLKIVSLNEPPPEPPATKNSRGEKVKACDRCEIRPLCLNYPSAYRTWDEFLASIGDYPMGEKCLNCPYIKSCRSFRAVHGTYPCLSKQKTLVNTL